MVMVMVMVTVTVMAMKVRMLHRSGNELIFTYFVEIAFNKFLFV
jgi:hypothetical protein